MKCAFRGAESDSEARYSEIGTEIREQGGDRGTDAHVALNGAIGGDRYIWWRSILMRVSETRTRISDA